MDNGILIIPEGSEFTKETILAHMKEKGYNLEGVVIVTAREALDQGIPVDEIIVKDQAKSYIDKNMVSVMQAIDRSMKPLIEPPRSKFFDSNPHHNNRNRKYKR